MNDTKEEALCNNAQNHRQQLLHHQQEIERDLEAGSCADEEEEEEDDGREDDSGSGEEGKDGGDEDDDEGAALDGENGEATGIPKSSSIPPLYNVEPGCTPLGCYSAIATFIIMVLGIVALLMYSSPSNVTTASLKVDKYGNFTPPTVPPKKP